MPDTTFVCLLEDTQFANQRIFLTHDDCAVYDLPESDVDAPHNPFDLSHITADETDGLVKSLEGSRSDLASREEGDLKVGTQHHHLHGDLTSTPSAKSVCGVWLDREFERRCAWLCDLRAVEGDEREKHWPPPQVKTQSDLLNYSLSKRDVGWLNPGTSTELLRSFALAAFAEHFRRRLSERTEENSVKQRAQDFATVWSDLSDTGNFRLGVTHAHTVGMSNGKECRNMVYDYHPSSMQFHCFPVLSFPA
ncbi:MAG: hypothetical protein Q7T55_23325, partial [Solirubrobacteraceae bacterium]|nr:hypothetical protein [Solirubrobacteraceae bacterium]